MDAAITLEFLISIGQTLTSLLDNKTERDRERERERERCDEAREKQGEETARYSMNR